MHSIRKSPRLERVYERNECFCRSVDRDIRDTSALQDSQTKGTYRHVRIAEDVPGLRINHISTENMLLGVWKVAARSSVT
jgi:hypothetical protein